MSKLSASVAVGLMLASALGESTAQAQQSTGPAAPAPVVPLQAQGTAYRRLLASVDGPELYRALGRPDLADRYQERRALKIGLRVGGGALVLGGIVWGVVEAFASTLAGGGDAFVCLTEGHDPACNKPPAPSNLPWLVVAAGAGMLVAPAFIRTDPLSPAEKLSLIDTATKAPPLSLSITPAPAAGGAALVVGGRF